MKMAVARAVSVMAASSRRKGIIGEKASYRKPPKNNAMDPKRQSTKFENPISLPLYSFGVKSACRDGYAVKAKALQMAEKAEKAYNPAGWPCRNSVIARAPDMEDRTSGLFLPTVSTSLPMGSTKRWKTMDVRVCRIAH